MVRYETEIAGRRVTVDAEYHPAVYDDRAPENARAYVVKVYDTKLLQANAEASVGLRYPLSPDQAEIRRELIRDYPGDMDRLRAEALGRVELELDCRAAEAGNVRRDAQVIA